MPDTIVPGNSQNSATVKHVNTHSRFDMSYHNFNTMRFGELTPHFVMECVPKDSVNLRCAHTLRSYSIKAPLMQDIQLKKDYFAVPMEAILPNNWEKIYTNPVIGDDVPSDAGTYVSGFTGYVNSILVSLLSYIPDPTNSGTLPSSYWKSLFDFILTSELFASNGNLMSSLGIHLNPVWRFKWTDSNGNTTNTEFDQFFDLVTFDFISDVFSTQYPDEYITVTLTGGSFKQFKRTQVHAMIEFMRDNLGNFTLTMPTHLGSNSGMPTNTDLALSWTDNTAKDFGLDLKRLFAYQIVCAHYYSNDHVDYIYSAELYRQYLGNLITKIFILDGSAMEDSLAFLYNGSRLWYDWTSAKVFNLFTYFIINFSSYLSLVLPYLQAIFSFRHSLRFMDYFSGARTQPLAVGDVNVDVQSGTPNYVSIIDVTQHTQMQKYLNAINKSGRKFSNYIKELFGNSVAPDYHNPFYLGHTNDSIYGQEIENTADAQQTNPNSVTAVLRSNASKFEFNFDADRPCIVLGISYFDIVRNYFRSIEKQNFHKDRFDMFNPYMQFIGDQAITRQELNSGNNFVGQPFGYTNRYQEYHQRYNQASGGFINNLPGYLFLNDMYEGDPVLPDVISPDFIRSKSYELDGFYISLTGYSLASYFHFIVDNYNDCKASRPMAYAPSIL